MQCLLVVVTNTDKQDQNPLREYCELMEQEPDVLARQLKEAVKKLRGPARAMALKLMTHYHSRAAEGEEAKVAMQVVGCSFLRVSVYFDGKQCNSK